MAVSPSEGAGAPRIALGQPRIVLLLRHVHGGRRSGGGIVVGVDSKVVQDGLGGFGGRDDGDDLHGAAALIALEDIDGEYAP